VPQSHRCRRAQQPIPVIAYLGVASPSKAAPVTGAFRQGLSETGYVDGQNLAIEHHWVENRYDLFPALAADFVQRKLDLIATGNIAAALALKSATSTIPIVVVAGDLVEDGVVASLLDRAATPPASASCILSWCPSGSSCFSSWFPGPA
jgi:putative ABC transport system substrate-binding protein